jgi:hypothetical protein
VRVRRIVAGMYLDFEVGGARAVGGDIIRILESCSLLCVPSGVATDDLGELSSVGKRWTVHVLQRALCPPVCRSLGGHALSEDGRRCSFELPTHPRFAVQ